MKITDVLYLAFSEDVVALDKVTGEIHWKWRAPKGASYSSLLLDGDRLFVSIDGYTYCLDALTGSLRWQNELKGLGTGVPVMVSALGFSSSNAGGAGAAEAARRASTPHTGQ